MELFGWVIRQRLADGAQYLQAIRIPDSGETEFGFLNSQHNATVLDTAMKDSVIRKLCEKYPASRFEAVALFWQESSNA